MTLSVVQCTDESRWDASVNALLGHPQQLWGWGQTKASHGWSVDRVLVQDGGELVGSAQLLLRKLPLPFRALAYCPRGPQTLPGREAEVLAALEVYTRRAHRPVALCIEPDWEADAAPAQGLAPAGWRSTESTILIGRTLILDLTLSEDELLAAMSKKHRQYIRKSGREDLQYREVTRSELPQCLAVYRETADRAGFGIHENPYYLDIFDNLGSASPVYAAFQGDDVVAFLWLSVSDHTVFELYGGMTAAGEHLRANYALKWLAIQSMKERGAVRYDFNGLLNDGVSKFKMGWAKHENQLAGSWDKPLSPLYPVYSRAMPLARDGLRLAQSTAARVKATLKSGIPRLKSKIPGRSQTRLSDG